MAGPSELRTHRVVMFSSHSTRHELWLTVNESIRTKGKQEQTGLEIPPETAPVSQLTGFYLCTLASIRPPLVFWKSPPFYAIMFPSFVCQATEKVRKFFICSPAHGGKLPE